MIINSYSSLIKIDSFISKYFSDLNIKNDIKTKAQLKILISSMLLNLKCNNLENFFTNEYFVKSIKVKNSDLINYYNKFHKYENDKIFEILKKSFNLNIYNMESLLDKYLIDLRKSKRNIEVLSEGVNKKIKEKLKNDGFIIYENIYENKFINRINKAITRQSIIENDNCKSHIYGNGKLQRIWNLSIKIKGIDDIIFNSKIITILENFYDRNTYHQKYYLSSFQANILYDGAAESVMHRDDNIPDPHPGWPIKLNFLIPLVDIDNSNGATEFIIKSHLNNLKLTEDQIRNSDKFTLKLKKGSIACWTGKLWHRSTQNNSGKPRIVLLLMFVASYIREASNEENYTNNFYSIDKVKNKQLFRQILGVEQGVRIGVIK